MPFRDWQGGWLIGPSSRLTSRIRCTDQGKVTQVAEDDNFWKLAKGVIILWSWRLLPQWQAGEERKPNAIHSRIVSELTVIDGTITIIHFFLALEHSTSKR